jgi:hypothetical protein
MRSRRSRDAPLQRCMSATRLGILLESHSPRWAVPAAARGRAVARSRLPRGRRRMRRYRWLERRRTRGPRYAEGAGADVHHPERGSARDSEDDREAGRSVNAGRFSHLAQVAPRSERHSASSSPDRRSRRSPDRSLIHPRPASGSGLLRCGDRAVVVKAGAQQAHPPEHPDAPADAAGAERPRHDRPVGGRGRGRRRRCAR